MLLFVCWVTSVVVVWVVTCHVLNRCGVWCCIAGWLASWLAWCFGLLSGALNCLKSVACTCVTLCVRSVCVYVQRLCTCAVSDVLCQLCVSGYMLMLVCVCPCFSGCVTRVYLFVRTACLSRGCSFLWRSARVSTWVCLFVSICLWPYTAWIC